MISTPHSLLEDILPLLNNLNSTDTEKMIPKVIDTAAQIANADGCFFFHVTPQHFMNLIYSWVDSLNLSLSGTSNMRFFPSVFLPDSKNKKNKRPSETCAIYGKIINSKNIFTEPNIETNFFKDFDKINDYTTVSVLTFPLFDSKQNVIGVAQFLNARDSRGKIINFTGEIQDRMIAVCQIISSLLERKQQAESFTLLLESFIDILAKAIDAKSPYTGQHCQKVPIITRMLTTAAIDETQGSLRNFEMSDNEWYALHIAAWMHDCGKIITPEYIMDKSAKLETVHNRIHEIRNRFEILRRDAHIRYLQKRLQNVDTQEKLQAELVAKIKELNDDFEFIGRCNIGDTPLSQEDIARIDKISRRSFTRYFNRMAGLSWGERQLIDNPEAYTKPETEFVLQDRPEQLAAPYNRGELSNLKIKQGTINPDERKKINEHIVTTIKILKNLSLPQEFSEIVEYAGSHHERVDGKGYPNGLTGDQMSIPAKIMAIADVYEALTAQDRPYKEPKKLSEVLTIMRDMKNDGHLDPDLYDLFIKSGVYLEYAKEYINPAQIDDINPEEFL